MKHQPGSRFITTLQALPATLLLLLATAPAAAQLSLEQPPIDYMPAPVDDPVSRLQKKIAAGDVELRYDREFGYLKSVLKELRVPTSSQALVFSKTSFQLRRISPRTPRAVYFGDDVYVGWVQGGDVMEFSAVDPQQGAIFYTLDQREAERPRFTRHTHACLQCHGSTLTRGVPGHLVRSVHPAPDGHPILRAGTHLTDHSSPLAERWGGWYVTGQHGRQRHLGNLVVRAVDDPDNPDRNRGANAAELDRWFDTSPYLSGHSDIVALMVLEHQTQMHNLITRANFLTRVALRDERVMNRLLERPDDHRSESTVRRITSAGAPLVKYMLLAEEITLSDPIVGKAGFTEQFNRRGPKDSRGRSLYQLDLKTRLFKYPCSYLIYSEPFDRLPTPVKDFVYRRLWEVLSGKDTSGEFKRLSAADRQAILDILRQTKQGLPEYWKPAATGAAAGEE